MASKKGWCVIVALNFQAWKAEGVESGKWRQTIRSSTDVYAGCMLQLYTGQRTKACRKLLEAQCISVERVAIMERLVQPDGNTAITGSQLDEFAKADGFNTYADMWAFFSPRAEEGVYIGYLIKW